MQRNILYFTLLITAILLSSCNKKVETADADARILFLHHSTGSILWTGKPPSLFKKVAGKVSKKLEDRLESGGQLPELMSAYNTKNRKHYVIEEQEFPKSSPYGWNNFPYDYYNIWVKNAGPEPYLEEPTLEMLTTDYDLIILKHCFPVNTIQPAGDTADINSNIKTLPNYKLQYQAIKKKMHQFPQTKFIVFTGAAQVENNLSAEKAERSNQFFNWVREEWDEKGDNIYLWDLYELQTEGGLYLKDEYAVSPTDPHPNKKFAETAGKLLFYRIIDVIENDGSNTDLTGNRIDAG